MKTKSILVAAFAALLTLASCSKEETTTRNNETTRVVLNVEQAVTRGVGDAVPNGNAINFNDGYVVFANSNNVATDVFKIVTSAPGNGEVVMSGSVEFAEVSGESRHVYILGNVGNKTITAGTTNMETFVAQTEVEAVAQTDNVNASTVKNVTLYGKSSTIIDHTQNPSEAAVTVAPISSRIEIAQFRGGGDVTGYKVEGIFINNFYNKIAYNGVNGAELVSVSKEDQAKFTEDGVDAYSAAKAGYFYNEDNVSGIGQITGVVCKPANGVWAYNIPAPTNTTELPHIVVRVSGVTGIAGLSPSDTRWMTVTKFIHDGGPNDGTEINVFEPGKIYSITSFDFDEENLDVAPEMKTISAKVTVTLVQWEKETVKPW